MEGDERFKFIRTDPRFRLMGKRERKVKIDKRFTTMFKDKNFKLKYMVDKRGRPIELTSNDHLRRYYELDSSDESEKDESESTVVDVTLSKFDPAEKKDSQLSDSPSVGKAVQIEKAVRDAEYKNSGADKKSLCTNAEIIEHGARPKKSSVLSAAKRDVRDAAIEASKDGSTPRSIKADKIRASCEKGAPVSVAASDSQINGVPVSAKVKKSVPASDKKTAKKERNTETRAIVVSRMEEKVSEKKGSCKLREASVVSGRSCDVSQYDAADNDQSSSSDKEQAQQSAKLGKVGAAAFGDHIIDDSEKRAKLLAVDGPDYARGEGALSSDSDDSFYDENALDDPDANTHDDHYWGEIDKEAELVEEATARLAVCNMDWDRIKAVDLLVLLSSFKPAGGIIKAVRIFPSDYGLERMKEEELIGPKELNVSGGGRLDRDQANLSEKDLQKKQRERLRLYQLNRLKYYYAVVECDSALTASTVYEQCDGQEYESSSTILDLRFIPDDVTFDDRTAISEVTELSDLPSYKPSLFVNTALNQSKVDCTWDETDKDRLLVTNRKFTKDDLEAMDIKAYLASSSSEEDEEVTNKEKSDTYLKLKDLHESDLEAALAAASSDDEDTAIDKYRSILREMEQKESQKSGQNVEMEITWEPGLKESAETLVERKAAQSDLTMWDKYLEKRSDKKRQKNELKKRSKGKDSEDGGDSEDSASRQGKKNVVSKTKKKRKPDVLSKSEEKEQAELSLLVMDGEDNKKHFNMKKILDEENLSKKKKKKLARKPNAADAFEIDLNDPRFAAVYTSHLYNIDPSAQEFKKTKSASAIIEEKLRRRSAAETTIGVQKRSNSSALPQLPADGAKNVPAPLQVGGKAGVDASLAMLVKSIKAKTQTFRVKK